MPDHVFVMGMSRSGTTLLATVLDAHPHVSMAYELLPGGLPDASRCAELVESAVRVAGTDPKAVANRLRDLEAASLATFVRRAARTLVPPEELVEVFRTYAVTVRDALDSVQGRAHISRLVVERKQAAEGTTTAGFKLNSPSIKEFDKAFDDARYLYILRDPRDVLLSHMSNGFDRTTEQVAASWSNYLQSFLEFQKANPERAALVRYEDLVRRPEPSLREALDRVSVAFHQSMVDFVSSKASAQAAQHSNARNLSKGFFTSSVNRWAGRLDAADVDEIERRCSERMRPFGYRPAAPRGLKSIASGERQKMATRFAAKRAFYRDEYPRLLELFRQRATNLTWLEAARGEEAPCGSALIVRHDIDHDLDTALQLARWEHELGVRATYCALHTAWYYGELESDGYRHTDFLIEALQEIQGLGHEINLHNNFAALGLREGVDPIALLEREVMALRVHGVDVKGTSTHGDPLCRELGFRNYELFAESVYQERGGPRTVEHEGNRIRLGDVSMSDLGLEYEAYDLPRDEYITDSGGRLRFKRGTRGRAGLRRSEMAQAPPYDEILGVLTHPVWWDLTRDGGRDLADFVEQPAEWPVP